jgi:hypothetical protein
VGVCGYVPSCQVLNGAASQEPDDHGACPGTEEPLSHKEGPTRNNEVAKSYSFMIVGGRPGMICF